MKIVIDNLVAVRACFEISAEAILVILAPFFAVDSLHSPRYAPRPRRKTGQKGNKEREQKFQNKL